MPTHRNNLIPDDEKRFSKQSAKSQHQGRQTKVKLNSAVRKVAIKQQRRLKNERGSSGNCALVFSDETSPQDESPKYDSTCDIHSNLAWNSSSSRRQLRLLALRDGLQPGDIIEVLAPRSLRQKCLRWFLEVVDGSIKDQCSEDPLITSCKWWRDYAEGSVTGEDLTNPDLQSQEVRSVIDWGSKQQMMKRQGKHWIPKRGIEPVLLASPSDRTEIDKPKMASKMDGWCSQKVAPADPRSTKRQKPPVFSDETSPQDESPKYDSTCDIHSNLAWNSSSSRRQLRLLALRDGLQPGDIIEVLAPRSLRQKCLRWFLEVVDGSIKDQCSEDPLITSCKWWRDYAEGSVTGEDLTNPDLQSQEVRSVIDWGSKQQMMKRQGKHWIPKRGIEPVLLASPSDRTEIDKPKMASKTSKCTLPKKRGAKTGSEECDADDAIPEKKMAAPILNVHASRMGVSYIEASKKIDDIYLFLNFMRTTCEASAIQIISNAADTCAERLRIEIFNTSSVRWQQMNEVQKQHFRKQYNELHSISSCHQPFPENVECSSSEVDYMEPNHRYSHVQNFPSFSAFAPFSPTQGGASIHRHPLSRIITEFNPVPIDFMAPIPIRYAHPNFSRSKLN
jgi:hypothetical protein